MQNAQTVRFAPITEPEIKKELRQKLRSEYKVSDNKKLDPNLKRGLKHGWLLPYIVQIDRLLWGRWDYWAHCQVMPECAWLRLKMEPALALLENRKPESLPKFVVEQTLPTEPIPKIEWNYSAMAARMLDRTLDAIPTWGTWKGWESHEYVRYFLRWAFYGFGHPKQMELPKEPSRCEGASMRLYQTFDVGLLMLYPEDYWGRLLPEIKSKDSQQATGFFPTPLVVSALMSEIVNGGETPEKASEFYEPCVGTGSLMLAHSNYCLRGIGQDIDPLLLDCALFQFFLYAPWFAIPIWWLGGTDLLLGNSLSQDKPESVNAKYWVDRWFNSDSPENSESADEPTTNAVKSEELQEQIAQSRMPLTNGNGNPQIEQLSLFDLTPFTADTSTQKTKKRK